MSIKLSDSIRVGQQKPLEDKYFNELVPYTSTTQVNTLLPKAVRHIGLTVNINKEEYWYKDGIEDSNLVLKITNNDSYDLKNQEQDDRLENLEGENVVQYDLIHDIFSELQSEKTRNDIQDSMLYNLEGINYVWSPTNRTLTLYDREGTQLSQVSLVSLDNEGTDIRYNASTLSLELYNADNELLDSIPISSFIGSVGTQLQLNSNELQLRDSKGNILSTVSFSVSNIQGLQTALGGKLDKGGYEGTAQDLKDEIDSIQIGGRNLAKKSNTDIDILPLYRVSATYIIADDSTNPTGKIFKATNIVRQTDDYVFYIPFVNSPEKFSGNLNGIPLTISFYIRTNNSKVLDVVNETIDSNWKKVSFQYTWTSGNLHFNLSGADLQWFEIHSLKIEKGNKATDWTPAPEDKQDNLQDITGNIGVGKTDASATEKLDVNGNVKATGFKTPTGTATQALTANGEVFDLNTKLNIGLDTIFNFKNISAMTLNEFRSITPDIETIYFTEEQNSTGWQQVRYSKFTGISIAGLSETRVYLTDENSIELDSDSTFNLIDVENTKIKGIFEKDFVIIKFNAGVVTPATANQWFKIILKINGVQTDVSPVFYLLEPYGTMEEFAHSFALTVTPEMVANGATLHLKTSTNLTFFHPAITVTRLHKSTSANL